MKEKEISVPKVIVIGCIPFRPFTLEYWLHYFCRVCSKIFAQITQPVVVLRSIKELLRDYRFKSLIEVSISVEDDVSHQTIDSYNARSRIQQDHNLFQFQSCGIGTSMGEFQKSLFNTKVEINIAHAYDHLLGIALEFLFPGLVYKVTTTMSVRKFDHSEYVIWILTDWIPKSGLDRRRAIDLCYKACDVTGFYFNTLLDNSKKMYPIVEALQELRSMYDIS